jgi:hypothetical protein
MNPSLCASCCVQYGQGSVEVYLCSDIVSVGNLSLRTKMGVAMWMNDSFMDMMPDGIVGMGFEGLSQITKPPWFQRVEEEVCCASRYPSPCARRARWRS